MCQDAGGFANRFKDSQVTNKGNNTEYIDMEDTREKENFMRRFQRYLDTEKGRVLLNYLYSWGAAIVILGALFKLTHIQGANLMLFLGMGTEVIVFFISGFEKPFIPEQEGEDEEDEIDALGSRGDIRINGSFQPAVGGQVPPASDDGYVPFEGGSLNATSGAIPQVPVVTGGGELNVDGIENVTQNYIDQVRELTEKLEKVSEQSDLLQRSTDEIDTLGRNLVSLNTFYEMHLRSVSSQMDNLDRVKEQTSEMVRQIEELNKAYARMVEALKVNSTGTSQN